MGMSVFWMSWAMLLIILDKGCFLLFNSAMTNMILLVYNRTNTEPYWKLFAPQLFICCARYPLIYIFRFQNVLSHQVHKVLICLQIVDCFLDYMIRPHDPVASCLHYDGLLRLLVLISKLQLERSLCFMNPQWLIWVSKNTNLRTDNGWNPPGTTLFWA